MLVKPAQLLPIAGAQFTAFDGGQPEDRRLVPRMGDVNHPGLPAQCNYRFGGENGKNPPAELRVEVHPDKAALGMPIDVRVIDVSRSLDQPVAGHRRCFRQSSLQTPHVFRLNNKINIQRIVFEQILVISEHAITNSFPVEDLKQRR